MPQHKFEGSLLILPLFSEQATGETLLMSLAVYRYTQTHHISMGAVFCEGCGASNADTVVFDGVILHNNYDHEPMLAYCVGCLQDTAEAIARNPWSITQWPTGLVGCPAPVLLAASGGVVQP